MKKKSEILSLLALGAVIPASMAMVGCNTPVVHGESSTTAFDDYKHWKSCVCGDANCENKYKSNNHSFTELERATVDGVITIEYGCDDCAHTKTEVIETEQHMFNKLATLITKYKNLEKSYTASIGPGSKVSFNHNTRESVSIEEGGIFTKIKFEESKYIGYYSETNTYKEVDEDNVNFAGRFLFDYYFGLPSFNDFSNDAASSITKNDAGMYTATLKVSSTQFGQNVLVVIKFYDDHLESWEQYGALENQKLKFTNEFDSYLFNYNTSTEGFNPQN